MQLLKITSIAAVSIFAMANVQKASAKECEQVCFSNLPCAVTQIKGDHLVDTDLCVGNLVLEDHSRIILSNNGDHLINIEGTLIIDGQAEIVTQSSLLLQRKAPKPDTPPKATTYQRGPDTDGPGDAGDGARGGDGAAGVTGEDGRNGVSAPSLTLRLNEFSGGALKIVVAGGQAQDGQDGGDGGHGGDGQQGGRAVPGQPFGCASGPGHGGDGGTGGNAGSGGNGGNGGDGGRVLIEVVKGQFSNIKSLISNRILFDVSGGKHGLHGQAGSPGFGGDFGFGGRGATGCDGRVNERKGKQGSPGQSGKDGNDGRDGQIGKYTVREKN